MKKQFTVMGIFIVLITIGSLTAAAQQKEGKNNKKQQEHGAGKSNGKPAKAPHGHAANENDSHAANSGNPGKRKNQAVGSNNVNASQHRNNGAYSSKNYYKAKHKNVNNEMARSKGSHSNRNNDLTTTISKENKVRDTYTWDSETFRNRKKIRDQEKVAICHKFNNVSEPAVSINVSSNAVKAHLQHGDVVGACAAVKNNQYSSAFLQKRTDYYNTIQNNHEQVSYSQSIYNYAVQQLNSSRVQLAALQNKSKPLAEIERKQNVVVELEQNVSLLEALIGVATNVMVEKLQ